MGVSRVSRRKLDSELRRIIRSGERIAHVVPDGRTFVILSEPVVETTVQPPSYTYRFDYSTPGAPRLHLIEGSDPTSGIS